MTSDPYILTAEDVIARWERIDGTALTDREMTPEERLALVREVQLGMYEAARRATNRLAVLEAVLLPLYGQLRRILAAAGKYSSCGLFLDGKEAEELARAVLLG